MTNDLNTCDREGCNNSLRLERFSNTPLNTENPQLFYLIATVSDGIYPTKPQGSYYCSKECATAGEV